jgi:geranylgeranyl diphosphate synthase type I
MNTATLSPTQTIQQARALASVLLEHADLISRVEARMIELAGDRIQDPAARMVCEHLDTGGKRLRARLALAACDALGGSAEDSIDWAAAVELLHNASLVHDDIQDGDRSRRGRPALWARHGTAQAINAGDLLLMLPFRALGRYPAEMQAALVQILAEYAERTARGQVLELGLSAATGQGWGDYFTAVSGKTGTLFALPVCGAARLAGLPTEAAKSLASVFTSIGVIYQLQDDLLDLFDAKGRGARGSDIYEGRLSAAVLTHLDLHPDDADVVFEVLAKPRHQTSADDVDRLIVRMMDGGATAQLAKRIESLAAELLASPILRESLEMHAVARELVQQVLAPLELTKGAYVE